MDALRECSHFALFYPLWTVGIIDRRRPLFSASASDHEGVASIDAREQQRQQERERALQNQNAPQADARFSRPDVVLPDYPTDEHPCFVINRLTLIGESADRFQWALDAAADAKGRCGQSGHCAHHQ